MKRYLLLLSQVLSLLMVLGSFKTFAKEEPVNQRIHDFNFDWEFALVKKYTPGMPEVSDVDWKEVRLPHDWSVEAPFDSIQGDGATGYLLGGYGFYRKTFDLDISKNPVAYIYFDGVYNNSEVWINGVKLGDHPYGYSPFYYDLSKHLNKNGKDNLIEVKVDRSRYVDSRWYTGSGIYRNVKLITTAPLHVPVWGTYVTTPLISEKEATVAMEVKVTNQQKKKQKFQLCTEIFDAAGEKVMDNQITKVIGGFEEALLSFTGVVQNPKLWSLESPHRYTVVTTIMQKGKVIDRYETPFGIRTSKFDADKGYFLNGKNVAIKGVCLHHDAGLVGSAVPKDVWKRRFNILKEAGVNAIRISHNPGDEDFLDLCDEMGILVQEEFFDEWDNPKDKRLNMNERHDDYISRGYTEHFQEWAESDLKATMLRDRNRPSIIQWSIGNEIEWTYPRYRHSSGYFNMNWSGNYFWELPPISPEEIKQRYEESAKEGEYVLAETAQKLSDWTKEMDTTRAVVANCILPSVSHMTGYADALDVIGYSYRRVLYDYGHELAPELPVMGTENVAQWHEWKAIEERPFISGTFLWTGIDYMGESHNRWPKKGTASGMIDFAGFTKPSYHMMKTLWNEQPHIYIATQTPEKSIFKLDSSATIPVEKKAGQWQNALWEWHDVNEHWDYKKGDVVMVELYSNCESIELFLNNTSLGKRQLADFEDHIYKWAVPFEAGVLEAKGMKDGKVISTKIASAEAPHKILLVADKTSMVANQYDATHIVAQVVDAKGNPVKSEESTITFEYSGDAKLLGVDNGHAWSVQPFQTNTVTTHLGKALMILQSLDKASTVTISAHGKGLKSNTVTLLIQEDEAEGVNLSTSKSNSGK